MLSKIKSWYSEKFRGITRVLWAAVLVTLPVTSFRFMPFMGADTQVRPLALIPAGLLLLLLLIDGIQKKKLVFWNRNLSLFLLFILVALFSSVAGFFLAPVNLYQYSYDNRVLRAWITLAVGIVFLLAPISMCRNEKELKFTLKWLFVGFGIQFLWSIIQFSELYIFQVYFPGVFNNLVDNIQKTIMVSGLSANNRISGFSLEPSWLAAQLVTMYIPWIVASLLVGYRWSRWRWFAPFALVVCLVMLILTYSRSGIIIALAAIFLTMLITGRERIGQAWKWLVKPFHAGNHREKPRRMEVLLHIGIFCVGLGALAGGAWVLSTNYYFSRLWEVRNTNLVEYFIGIYAGPRLAYALAGWNTFLLHPWTGVGLGGVGFYLQRMLPDWSHFNMPEIARLIASSNTTFPNTKDLYIRLLAETGILGLFTFISFYAAMLGKTLNLIGRHKKELVFLGSASLMAILAIIAFGLSQDSFAMANIWLPIGIMLGMSDANE